MAQGLSDTGALRAFGQTFTDLYTPKNPTIVAKSAAYELVAGDNNNILHTTGTWTLTLPTGLTHGYNVTIVNTDAAGVITFSSTATVNGEGTTLDKQWGAVTAYTDGTDWFLIGALS